MAFMLCAVMSLLLLSCTSDYALVVLSLFCYLFVVSSLLCNVSFALKILTLSKFSCYGGGNVRSCVMQVLWFILLLIDPSSGQRSADSLQLLT